MEAPSFVSKARTAFHSAAAKAERVFSDLKPDRDSDKQYPKSLTEQSEDESPNTDSEPKVHNELKNLRWRPAQIVTKQDWQDRFRNIKFGKKGFEDTEKVENSAMSVPYYDENLYLLNMKNDLEAKSLEAIPSVEGFVAASTGGIPPAAVMKQLAVAVEAAKKRKSLKDCLTSSGGSSPVRERAGLSLSAVKSLVLREKEDKLTFGFGDNEKVLSLINSLFDAEGKFLRRKISADSEATTISSLPRDIHGSPSESLVVKLAEVIGSFRTLHKMALFWRRVVAKLRTLWYEGQYVPGIPLDEIPDLHSCLLYQQLQVLNCCVSRKRRRAIANKSLDYVMKEASSNDEESAYCKPAVPASPVLYARLSTGELVLRLGADHPFSSMTMLETGEPVYSPVTQEGPLLTEDLLKETEEFVLRTGSVGAGCSQLLSDMQAFKAANPGCILEDFVRWHSPPDWTETEPITEGKDATDCVDLLSTRGQLSSRMQKEGNLWWELWETAKAVPAVKQSPLFDEDLAVEGILNFLEDMPPSELFEQLFVSLLGLGFVIAEARLSSNNNLSNPFNECKDYVLASCQGSIKSEKFDDLCQVYETVETMLLNPDEVLTIMKQPDETMATAGEPKRLFKRLGFNFGGRKPASEDHKGAEENPNRQPFSSFFDGKSSLFSRKPPKPETIPPAEKPLCPDEDGWTVV
ncbi:Rab3 GTPase-activating protein catalytic subunit [Morella rubra]|uniref:Rab3 GTPase-activating protein catalytic subunit n=1 Tax=Morella rubra TaxID=262757 RepID=A0A6A1VT07_9ROSI|nr:Rab3 GTPase-activating protein catalytic subunit [Morella rubra]